MYEHGRAKPQGGTSAATPMFAGAYAYTRLHCQPCLLCLFCFVGVTRAAIFLLLWRGSIACPCFTLVACPSLGVISLLNEERLRHGMPPMGLLNPWLYKNPDILTDITVEIAPAHPSVALLI